MARTADDVAALTDPLFDTTAAYQRSHAARARENLKDRSFVYGESLLVPFQKLMLRAGVPAGGTFVDLGCGAGRAVIYAALLFDLRHVVGVELLEDLVDAARAITRALERAGTPLPTVEWIHGSMLDADLRSADVVYTVSAVFSEALMVPLCAKLAEVKSGAAVVALGQMLDAPSLVLEARLQLQADWGPTAGYVYRAR